MEVLISKSKTVLLNRIGRNPLNFSIGNFRFLVSKFGEELVAFESHCPHSGYSLESAVINPYCELVCPWHGHSFHLTSGLEKDNRSRKLVVYRILEKSEGIYVVLPDDIMV